MDLQERKKTGDILFTEAIWVGVSKSYIQVNKSVNHPERVNIADNRGIYVLIYKLTQTDTLRNEEEAGRI